MNKKINGDIGREVLRKQLSLYFEDEVTDLELDNALNVLTSRVIADENNTKDRDKTRINKLLLLRMFKFMYSTDSGLRQKTRSEVLDAYSATDVIIDQSNSDMIRYLINIINDDRINNTVRIGNINVQAR